MWQQRRMVHACAQIGSNSSCRSLRQCFAALDLQNFAREATAAALGLETDPTAILNSDVFDNIQRH